MTRNTNVQPPARFSSLRTEGPPFDVGRSHGTAFGDEVLGSISVYRQRFEDIGLDWAVVLDLAERSGGFLRSLDPALAEELDGIADGADVDPREILAINIRTGLTRMVDVAVAEDHECTTAAVLSEATSDGHVLMGQNWDQRGVCQPNTVVVEQHIPGQPALLFVTEAGTLFRHGMNDAGVGVVGNALRTDRESSVDKGAPPPVLRRRALRERRLEDAKRALVSTPRSHSGNNLLADSHGDAVDIEVVPDQFFPVGPEGDVLVHSNHFLHPDAAGVLDDRGVRTHPDTLFRDGRVRTALASKRGMITISDVQDALKDHFGYPKSVCRHPDPDATSDIGYTLASTVMDLTERRMWTAPGPACVGTYTEYSFS